MIRKVVIASDSFKGCLSSAEVALSAEAGAREALPSCELTKVSVADGGEGTASALADVLGGSPVRVIARDPLLRPVETLYMKSGDTALIDLASASGLTLLKPAERNPWITSTRGTGELIMDAFGRGCRKFLIGIGGSATNDAGTGMAEALGFRFFDKGGNLLQDCCGGMLERIASTDISGVSPQLLACRFTIACDVDTVFYGHQAAAETFAPQKGADPVMTARLDKGMESFASAVLKQTGMDLNMIKGSGAAGGTGGFFKAFLSAELKKGIDMILDAMDFDRLIEGADLVITGEGSIDAQTAHGKTASGILARASAKGIPVIAIAGRVERCPEVENLGFKGIYQVSKDTDTTEYSMRKDVAGDNIRRTVAGILSSLGQ